jgi:hypothetical protein
LAAPVMRTVARMELPSTNARTTAARSVVESLFILTIMRDQISKVKGCVNTSENIY